MKLYNTSRVRLTPLSLAEGSVIASSWAQSGGYRPMNHSMKQEKNKTCLVPK